MVRRLVKAAAWLLGSCVLVLAAWFGINQTDQALSEEARAAMVLSPLPAPSSDNAYLDFLVLGAPASVPTFEAAVERLGAIRNQKGGVLQPPAWGQLQLDPRLPHCAFGAVPGETWNKLSPCVEAAASVPQLLQIIASHDTFLRRYRAMREKPRFINLQDPSSEMDALPDYREIMEGQRLTVLLAAQRFKSGDRSGALRELEQEMAFYRRMLRDATMLIDKMIAVVALDRASLFAVELARHTSRGDRMVWRRLEALLADHPQGELDLSSLMRREYARRLRWILDRQFVRLANPLHAHSSSGKPPWWDPVSPYLYRPNQSANWLAASMTLFIRAGERPPPEWAQGLNEARAQSKSLAPGPVMRAVLNPAGWNNPHIAADYGDYAARVHARANLQAVARLIVKLREAGISQPDQVEAALAGPLGEANADPFNRERFRFDPRTRTIGFEAESKHISGSIRPMRDRYGRMAVPL